jgi:hypothetical protein
VIVADVRMKNDQCVIYFRNKKRIVQTIYKNKDGWIQKSARRNLFPMTAEQVLSHILPPLAGKSKAIIEVKVRRKK